VEMGKHVQGGDGYDGGGVAVDVEGGDHGVQGYGGADGV
jgi:hypothetical protein